MSSVTQAASSTVDIQELVTRLQNEANNAVRSMDKGSDSAQRCLIKATATAKTFEKASEAVGEISDLNALGRGESQPTLFRPGIPNPQTPCTSLHLV